MYVIVWLTAMANRSITRNPIPKSIFRREILILLSSKNCGQRRNPTTESFSTLYHFSILIFLYTSISIVLHNKLATRKRNVIDRYVSYISRYRYWLYLVYTNKYGLSIRLNWTNQFSSDYTHIIYYNICSQRRDERGKKKKICIDMRDIAVDIVFI